MIISIYVQYEFTFDHYKINAKRIARITVTVHTPGSDIAMATSSTLLASVLKNDYPEVEASVRNEKPSQTIRTHNEYFREDDFYKTEQSIFSIFSFEEVEGSLKGGIKLKPYK